MSPQLSKFIVRADLVIPNGLQAAASDGKLHSKMLDDATKTSGRSALPCSAEWGVDAYQYLLEISMHQQRHVSEFAVRRHLESVLPSQAPQGSEHL